MILFEKVSKSFGQKIAVKELSFRAKKGEIIGFLGPNGAGKTTTMRLINGLLKPNKGTVTVFNHNPITHHVEVASHIGYLPENNPLYGEMKVREYLEFIGDIKNEEDIHEIIHMVDLKDVVNVKIEELSRGYKQRVGLSAALCGRPEILILDEPTSGLDPIEQDKIKSLISRLSKNTLVIFSTHMLSEVEDVATRVIMINKGEVRYDGKKPAGKGAVEKLFKKLIKDES